jgi:hypothetical protein
MRSRPLPDSPEYLQMKGYSNPGCAGLLESTEVGCLFDYTVTDARRSMAEERGAYPPGPRYSLSSAPPFLLDRSHVATTHKGTRRSVAAFLGNCSNLGGDTGPVHERIPVPRGDVQQLDAFPSWHTSTRTSSRVTVGGGMPPKPWLVESSPDV